MKILITGGAGYVGSSLIQELCNNNQIISIDDYSVGLESNHIDHINVTYIKKHSKNVNRDFILENSIELIYHLGEYSRIAPSFKDIEAVFDSNIVGSFNIIKLCSELNIPLVYSASSTKFATEGVNHSPYSYFKGFSVELVKNYGKWFNLNYSICYFYNVYGSDTKTAWNTQNYQNVIDVFKHQKSLNLPLTVTGDGSQTRDFTHVRDIVNGLILSSKQLKNKEYFLGTGIEYSILDIAKLFNHPIEYIEARPGDRKNSELPVNDTQKELKWIPQYNVEQYIKD